HPQRREVAGGHYLIAHARFLTLLRPRLSVNDNRDAERVTADRERDGGSHGPHTWKSRELLQQVAIKRPQTARIVLAVEHQIERQEVARVDPDVHPREHTETSEQEAGADQEHERETDLRHDEEITGSPGASARGATTAAFSKIRRHSGSGDLARR